ncbi:uncharacterized protein LOC135922190 [Gordionus sp. m RMFG-2023]|uniref:uncharacterized protein LOC135922190 n=1 Tax=Gordionus sp. m RMFG-2023 TaxID=3053472 RepID=UPI0031FDF926
MAFDWESEDDIALTDNEEDEFDPIFEEYVLHDDDASCHGILDDQDICNQIRLELEEGYESSENDEGNQEISDHLITKNQALNGYYTFLEYAHEHLRDQDSLRKLENIVEKELFTPESSQTLITKYFY